MNILWIEDFGGLSAGKNILNQMFGDLLSFDAWDNKKLSLISRPADLNEFCSQQNSLHTIYLCRHYVDYVSFKNSHDILNEIDLIITDIRLDNLDDDAFDFSIPESYSDIMKFHENAGFFIFNDLIYLGFPESKMCFMTGEKNSFKGFAEKCNEIYMPQVTAFEKTDVDYENLRNWIQANNSNYGKLRRGIIEGCRYLKRQNHSSIPFNQLIQSPENHVNPDEMRDYLDILQNFLPLRKPEDKAALYKLFIRTLTHEWEATEPKKIRGLGWIMKNARNWITHNSSLFNETDENLVAYLFMINMRLMFSFDEAVQGHEKILLSLFSEGMIEKSPFENQSKNNLLPVKDAYQELQNKASREKVKDAFRFPALANNIQESESELRKDKPLFYKVLYQMFWLINAYPRIKIEHREAKIEFKNFDYTTKAPYLYEIARHIYHHSFS